MYCGANYLADRFHVSQTGASIAEDSRGPCMGVINQGVMVSRQGINVTGLMVVAVGGLMGRGYGRSLVDDTITFYVLDIFLKLGGKSFFPYEVPSGHFKASITYRYPMFSGETRTTELPTPYAMLSMRAAFLKTVRTGCYQNRHCS